MFNIHLTSLNDINKVNLETKKIYEKVIEELEFQGDILKHVDTNLNKSKTTLDTSNQIIKQMSWYGWFISLIPFSSFFSNIINKRKKENIFFIKNNQNVRNDDQNGNNENVNIYDNLLENAEELNQLEKDIMDLKWIGEKIGSHLDSHNDYIDEIYEKTQILSSYTNKSNEKIIKFL